MLGYTQATSSWEMRVTGHVGSLINVKGSFLSLNNVSNIIAFDSVCKKKARVGSLPFINMMIIFLPVLGDPGICISKFSWIVTSCMGD